MVVGGPVSFSRDYQALKSGSVSDFTRGKSSLQLLLIRVKWSRPTNSYRTPKKPLLSLSLSLSLSLHPSLSVLNLGFRVKLGRGFVARALDV